MVIPPQNTRPEATPTAGELRGMKKRGAGEMAEETKEGKAKKKEE